MNGKLAFCGILAILAITVAAPPPADKKCLPAQWEALQIGKVAQLYKNHEPQVLSVMTNRSDDFTNKMLAIHEVLQMRNREGKEEYTFFSVVADFNKMMMYDFSPDKKTCKTTKLMEKMELFCSDSDSAKLSHSFMLDGKMVDLYDVEHKAFGRTRKMFISLFRDSFTPISEAIEEEYKGTPRMVVYQYGNVTTGINDKSVFNIPTYCH